MAWVYVVTKYWDNDENDPEDFQKDEYPIEAFNSLDKAVEYIRNIKASDVLSSKQIEKGWIIDFCGPELLSRNEICPNLVGQRYFHAKRPFFKAYQAYRESANYSYVVYELELK